MDDQKVPVGLEQRSAADSAPEKRPLGLNSGMKADPRRLHIRGAHLSNCVDLIAYAAARQGRPSTRTAKPQTYWTWHNKHGAPGEANERRAAAAKASAASDFRLDKVHRLKEALANGTYRIDAISIAEKLLDEHVQWSAFAELLLNSQQLDPPTELRAASDSAGQLK